MTFENIRNYLNNNFETYISEWFPNAHKEGGFVWKTGDFNDTKTKRGNGSLVFNTKEKFAKDFATGETAGDIISIYAHRFCNGNQKKALNEIINRYGLEYLVEKDNKNNNKNNKNNNKDNNNNNKDNKDDINKNTQHQFPLVNAGVNDIQREIQREVMEDNNNKPTKDDIEKDNKIKNILSKMEHYKKGDPVDLYLKRRGINKYSPDTYIVNTDKMAVLVNVCYKTIKNTEKDYKLTGQLYRKTESVAGIQEIFLTKDGQKRDSGATVSKIQRSYFGNTISGNPVRLTEKGDNNGYIYITEGVENGLSLQEYINNEVWCALSIVNIPNLPFDKDKIYIIVLDNDFGKEHKTAKTEYIVDNLKRLDIKYKIEDKQVIYDTGEYNFKTTINKLENLKDKHIFYLQPTEQGKDANDLLKENKLKDLLLNTTPTELKNEYILKLNKKTKEVVYWRPQKHYGTNDNDNLSKEFINTPYDNNGIALRFFKRYGHLYKKVDGIGICKYDGEGKYKQKQEDELFEDIQQTLFMTYYEFDYLTDKEQIKSFKKLWIDRGVGEFNTVSKVEEYIKRMKDLNIDINEFDNENDNIINLANGYFDLDKNKLFEHTNNKLFFRKLDTEYKETLNLGYKYSEWNKYLLSSFCNKIDGSYENDKEGLKKIRFLQKAIGYTFSTSVKEEKIFIIKGVTRSGKSTFLDTIQEVMGDYCGDTQDEEFITSRDQNNNYLLSIRASLKGKRFLHISEISKNKKLNGAQIKRLVGNRTITAKFMHQNSFSYKQQTKYWIATNNIDFNEFDESIKTKLFIIDFDKRFYEAGTPEAIETGRVIDKNLKDRLLTKESKEFILKWIIEGYRMYKEEGLEQTEEMKETLNQLEIDNDSMGMFIKDCMRQFDTDTQFVVGGQKSVHEVYKAYREYEAFQYGTPEENIIGLRKFIKNMRNRGFNIDRKYIKTLGQQEYYIEGWCMNTEDVKNVPTTEKVDIVL